MKYMVDITAQRFIRCVSDDAAHSMPSCGGLLQTSAGGSSGGEASISPFTAGAHQTVGLQHQVTTDSPVFFNEREKRNRYGTEHAGNSIALLDYRSPFGTIEELAASGETHLVTRSGSTRHSSTDVRYHTHDAAYPARSFWLAGDEFAIATPALSFLQMGTNYSLLQLVQYGSELCGTFSMPPTREGDLISRERPLATPQELLRYVESARGMHGIDAARKALRYVVPMSASPMETKIEMFLCMPMHLGGCNARNPVMNNQVFLSPGARKVAGREFVRCDICWLDAKLDVEYDSRSYHFNDVQFRKDKSRTNGLKMDDWDVIQLTDALISDFHSLECVARDIVRRTGGTWRTKDMRRYEGVRRELHRMLFKDVDAFWW